MQGVLGEREVSCLQIADEERYQVMLRGEAGISVQGFSRHSFDDKLVP